MTRTTLLPRAAALLLAASGLAAQAAPTLTLSPCRLPGIAQEVRCGTLQRPLDATRPQGPQITLQVALIPALARNARPDPVVFIAGGPGQSAVDLVTENLFTQEKWLEYCDPTTIHAYQYDGKYVAFHSTGGFIFDPSNLDFTPITTTANAGYFDVKTGELFLCATAAVTNWHKGTGKQTYTWKSGIITLPEAVSHSCAQVIADDYTSLTLEVYSKSNAVVDVAKLAAVYAPRGFTVGADGVLKSTKTVLSGEPFRIPSGLPSEKWWIAVSGTSTVTSVAIGESMEDLDG